MTLHPQVKIFLEAAAKAGLKDYSELSVAQAREQYNKIAALRVFPKTLPEIQTKDISIARTNNQHITLRVYYPPNETQNQNKPAILFFHGGGFVFSNIDQYDAACRWMTLEIGTPIVSVDYRLAPEHKFPTQIEDSYAALEWLGNNLDQINLSSRKIIVAGDSAGGTLATTVAILARDRNGPEISAQILFYPWVDFDFARESYKKYASGYGLTTSATIWFYKHYMGDTTSGIVCPMQANLKNLPPTFLITAENDILSDEGLSYGNRLIAEGNIVTFRYELGMIHGFLNQYAIPYCFEQNKKLFKEITQFLT
jgi:acetyl esterase